MGLIDRAMHKFVWIISGEFLFTWPCRQANGGTIIFYRTLFVSLLLYSLALLLNKMPDPFINLEFVIKDTLPWFGAIFAAEYAALYTRFSSQWTYLAGLYNQIKAAEAQIATSKNKDIADTVLVPWKAGFIEDACELHLVLKPMFLTILRDWLKDKKLQDEVETYTLDGKERLAWLLHAVGGVPQGHTRVQIFQPERFPYCVPCNSGAYPAICGISVPCISSVRTETRAELSLICKCYKFEAIGSPVCARSNP